MESHVSDEKKNKRGRKVTKGNLLKHPLGLQLIKELAQRKATDREIYAALGISERSWYRWKGANQEFWQTCTAKQQMDDESVEVALLESARGFTKIVRKIDGDGKETLEERYFPPNVAATAFYLKNRKPHQWRDKIDISASMEQIPVRINFKRKEKAIVETTSTPVTEPKEITHEEISSDRQQDSQDLDEEKASQD